MLSGRFSIKSCYYNILMDRDPPDPEDNDWVWIWKLKLPFKIINFIWTLRHDKILSGEKCVSRGISNDPSCKLCGLSESSLHIFKDCRKAAAVWNIFGQYSNEVRGNIYLRTWLDVNLKNENAYQGVPIPWNIIFASTIWCLWINRNENLFRNNDTNHYKIAMKSYNMAKETYVAFHNNWNNASNNHVNLIHWRFPNAGLIKINTDGSKLQNSCYASYGGLARNDEGRWIEGFCGRVGATVLGAELWGLRQGLRLAKERGWEGVEVESDSKNGVDIINSNENVENHPERNLIEDCKSLKRQVKARIWHVLREANRCADGMAKIGASQREQHVRVLIPPDEVVESLMADLTGVAYPRGY